jgi:2-iminobutanoate/2-iminopropanoate deaminase
MELVNAKLAPAAIGPYSHAVVAGGFVFLSGQLPLDPRTMLICDGDISDQARQVLLNIKSVLAELDLSFGNIVKVTVFLKNMKDFAAVSLVYEEFFGEHKPARSTVEVAALPKDALIEIEVIASKL